MKPVLSSALLAALFGCCLIGAAAGQEPPAMQGASAQEKARLYIRENLIQIAPIFVKQKYMLGEEFSMLDVAIAPLLWRLDHYQVQLNKQSAPLLKYAERLFSRQAFIDSMTASEKAMRR